jgi:uncharacterized protein (TIGR01244 family)
MRRRFTRLHGVNHICAVLVVCIAVGSESSAQEVWFGVPLPHATAMEAEIVYQQRDFPVVAGQRSAQSNELADIVGASLFEFIEDQVDISAQNKAQGDLVWGRVAGRSGDRMVTAYIREQFDAIGLADVQVDTVEMPTQYWPVEAELTLIAGTAAGEGSQEYTFVTGMPQPGSPSTGRRGLAGALAYVGYGREIDIAGKDLEGKIAVLRGRPAQGAYNTARGVPDQLADAGAVGVIVIFDLPINVQSYNRALTGTQVPVFSIADHEGEFLERVMARAGNSPLSARMTLRLEADDSSTSNIIGRVAGTSDEYVIVIAHHDAYFDGAVDNASGVAAMLGLARHFADYPQPLRRTHIFVATGGHHAGGFPGATKFAEENLGIRDRTAIVLNAEHVAAVQAIQYTSMNYDQWGSRGGLLVSNAEIPRYGSIVPRNPMVFEQFSQSLAQHGVTMLANAWDQAPGDVWPFQRRGYPVGQIIEVGNWYHTTGDSLYTVHVPALERATRAFAEFLHRIDRLPIHEVNPTLSETDAIPKRNYPLAGVMTAGQPSEEGLRAAAAEGYTTVIDLRGPNEQRGFDEPGLVRQLGMSYVSFPIDGAEAISFANADHLSQLLAEVEGPVLLHCATGNRVGALLALRASQNGRDRGTSLFIGSNSGMTGLTQIVEERLDRAIK